MEMELLIDHPHAAVIEQGEFVTTPFESMAQAYGVDRRVIVPAHESPATGDTKGTRRAPYRDRNLNRPISAARAEGTICHRMGPESSRSDLRRVHLVSDQRLFLFDIDGTLLRGGTRVHREAFTYAFQTVYGLPFSSTDCNWRAEPIAGCSPSHSASRGARRKHRGSTASGIRNHE